MEKIKILFVCLGNICRSPSAEAVMKGLVKNAGRGDEFDIDSAGTAAWHAGEQADARMQTHALKRDYNLTSISRKVNPEFDFNHFDYIIAMDEQNMSDLQDMVESDEQQAKLHMMTDFSNKYDYNHIPDPYYGGDSGFELVLDLLEDACHGLLMHLDDERDKK